MHPAPYSYMILVCSSRDKIFLLSTLKFMRWTKALRDLSKILLLPCKIHRASDASKSVYVLPAWSISSMNSRHVIILIGCEACLRFYYYSFKNFGDVGRNPQPGCQHVVYFVYLSLLTYTNHYLKLFS